MRTWIARKPLLSFYILAILISWGYWFYMIASGQHVGRGSAASHFPGLLGPLLAAFIVTGLTQGRAGLADLGRRMLLPGKHWQRNLLLALSPLLLGACTFAGLALCGQPWPTAAGFAEYPGLPQGLSLAGVVLMVLFVGSYGEEAGWRGFALDPLLAQYGNFRGTLLLALLWLIWHLPLFILNEAMRELPGPMLIGWILGLSAGAFVLSQLYLASGRSILIVALWHAGYNMLVAPAAGAGLPAAVLSSIVMLWGIIVAVGWCLRPGTPARPGPDPLR